MGQVTLHPNAILTQRRNGTKDGIDLFNDCLSQSRKGAKNGINLGAILQPRFVWNLAKVLRFLITDWAKGGS